MATAGIAQVTPAGNLTVGRMQKTALLNANDSTTVTFTGGSSTDVWPSLRWRGNSGDVIASLQVNASGFVVLPANGTTLSIGGKSVYSDQSVSTAGTVMHILHIARSGSATYTLRLVNQTSAPKRVEAMLGDNGFSWTGLARWNSPSETNTVTWPATADSAIGVAAYRNKTADTNINSFETQHSGPQAWQLAQNYPNPFNPATHITFSLAKLERVTLKIYDVRGREVATLLDEVKAPGRYEVVWQANAFAGGVYFYRLSGVTFSETKKLILMK